MASSNQNRRNVPSTSPPNTGRRNEPIGNLIENVYMPPELEGEIISYMRLGDITNDQLFMEEFKRRLNTEEPKRYALKEDNLGLYILSAGFGDIDEVVENAMRNRKYKILLSNHINQRGRRLAGSIAAFLYSDPQYYLFFVKDLIKLDSDLLRDVMVSFRRIARVAPTANISSIDDIYELLLLMDEMMEKNIDIFYLRRIFTSNLMSYIKNRCNVHDIDIISNVIDNVNLQSFDPRDARPQDIQLYECVMSDHTLRKTLLERRILFGIRKRTRPRNVIML